MDRGDVFGRFDAQRLSNQFAKVHHRRSRRMLQASTHERLECAKRSQDRHTNRQNEISSREIVRSMVCGRRANRVINDAIDSTTARKRFFARNNGQVEAAYP